MLPQRITAIRPIGCKSLPYGTASSADGGELLLEPEEILLDVRYCRVSRADPGGLEAAGRYDANRHRPACGFPDHAVRHRRRLGRLRGGGPGRRSRGQRHEQAAGRGPRRGEGGRRADQARMADQHLAAPGENPDQHRRHLHRPHLRHRVGSAHHRALGPQGGHRRVRPVAVVTVCRHRLALTTAASAESRATLERYIHGDHDRDGTATDLRWSLPGQAGELIAAELAAQPGKEDGFAASGSSA